MTTRRSLKFVKSADTKATAANSKAECERILQRYGAAGFSVATEYNAHQQVARVMCEFIIPNSGEKGAQKVPVRIPIDVARMCDALYGPPKRGFRHNDDEMKRAERVAWRNMVLWIDAALSAASAGFQTITEAFLAHTLVAHDNGRTMRMADYLDEVQGALAPGVRALLASPAEVDA